MNKRAMIILLFNVKNGKRKVTDEFKCETFE